MNSIQDKIISYLKKNYIYVNIVFLIFAIYIILFPIISIPINRIFPQFGMCPYLSITGRPCPLCGGTRYIANFPMVFKDITYLLHPFGIMMIVIFCEIIFRIYNLLTIKKEKNKEIISKDLDIHVFLLNIFNIYEIVYIIIQLNNI